MQRFPDFITLRKATPDRLPTGLIITRTQTGTKKNTFSFSPIADGSMSAILSDTAISERKGQPERKGRRSSALLIGAGLFFWTQHTSDYELTEDGTGYVIAAERLNSSVVKEYDLEKGDTVTFYISELERGRLHLRLAENGEKPVFFTDFNQTGELTFEIGKDGRYDIEVVGDAMKGTVEVVIR